MSAVSWSPRPPRAAGVIGTSPPRTLQLSEVRKSAQGVKAVEQQRGVGPASLSRLRPLALLCWPSRADEGQRLHPAEGHVLDVFRNRVENGTVRVWARLVVWGLILFTSVILRNVNGVANSSGKAAGRKSLVQRWTDTCLSLWLLSSEMTSEALYDL